MNRRNKLAHKAMLARGVVREINAEERIGKAVAIAVRHSHREVFRAIRGTLDETIELALVCAQPRLMQ